MSSPRGRRGVGDDGRGRRTGGDGGDRGHPVPQNTGAARGIVLVLAFVVLGVVIAAKALDTSASTIDVTPGSAAATTTTTTPTSVGLTTTTTAAPANVKVVLANGAKVSGLAKAVKERLGATPFTITGLVTATNKTALKATAVYYAAGEQTSGDLVARTLADVLKLTPAPTAAPMPTTLPVKAADFPAGSSVLVVLGTDASK